MNRLSKLVLLGLTLITLFSCNSSGDGFSALEENIQSGEDSSSMQPDEEIIIESYSPTNDPVIVVNTQEKTFGINVASGAGEVAYTFSLDGTILQTSNSPFLNIDSSTISAGEYELKVIAENSVSSAEHIFNIRKNTPPTISLNSESASTIDCVTGTFNLSVTAFDLDGDSLNFSYLLNNSPNNTYINGSNGLSSSSIVFTPNCSISGTNTVTIRVTDQNGEYSDYSKSIIVTNPNIATIDAYSPTDNPIIVRSTESKSLQISASGNPPLNYQWDISSGSTIATCNDSTTCLISGGDFSPGAYTITSKVSDSLGTEAERDFNIVINSRPTVTFRSPENTSTISMNCNSSKNFNLTIEDLNFSNPGQTFTVDWFIDGNPSDKVSKTNNLTTHPMTSNTTFSPECDESLLGDHIIKAVVSDQYETVEVSWNLNINYISDQCNNLDSGEVCTLAGLPGIGSGLSVTSNKSRIYPDYMEKNPNGGWFISDSYLDVVWFYNDTSNTLTVLNIEVLPGTLKAVVGTGSRGSGTNGQSGRNFPLYDPKGLAFNSSTGDLYIADYGNHRIIKVTSLGTATHFAGQYNGSNADAVTRTNSRCRNPINIVLDTNDDKLFSTCYGNTSSSYSSIKYYKLSADEAYEFTRKGNNVAGTTTAGGTARTRRMYSLIKHPNKKILYGADNERCELMAFSYGDSHSYLDGDLTLSANESVRITRNDSCGNTINKAWNDSSGRLRAHSLALKMNGTNLEGWFLSNNNERRIIYLNNLSTAQVIGGRSIPSKTYNNVFGDGTSDYARVKPAYNSTYISSPLGIYVDNTILYVNDRGNSKIGTLDLSQENGDVGDMFNSIRHGGYDGEIKSSLNKIRLNRPRAISYNSVDNSLYFHDDLNYRLRKISLSTGQLESVVGRGLSGGANTTPENVSQAYMRNQGGLQLVPQEGLIFYTDYETNNDTSDRTCVARAANISGETKSIFGNDLQDQKVYTLAGNYTFGCSLWDSSYENSEATQTRLYEPRGIVVTEDLSAMYISNNNSHCINKVDSSGLISTVVGECGTSGDISGQLSSARINNLGPIKIDSDESLKSVGNFFLTERVNTTNSSVKYVNLSGATVTIAGVDIGPGEVQKIISSINYLSDVTSFEDQICYSQGRGGDADNYEHSVTCISRSTGIPTIRVGKSGASTVKGKLPDLVENEGLPATSVTISEPTGLTFDAQGNLYISIYTNNTIMKVKKWW